MKIAGFAMRIGSYCRISTKKQDVGLGAQKGAIVRFCADHGHEFVGEQFVEKRTGADDDRLVLAAAMAKGPQAQGPGCCG